MDAEGYPEDEELKFVEEFDPTTTDPFELVDFLQERWCHKDYFVFHRKKRLSAIQKAMNSNPVNKKSNYWVLELHTAGWSGNEDFIRALQKNTYWFLMYWVKSERGGHYYFEISKPKIK